MNITSSPHLNILSQPSSLEQAFLPVPDRDFLHQLLEYITDTFDAKELLLSPRMHRLNHKQTMARVRQGQDWKAATEKAKQQRKEVVEAYSRPLPSSALGARAHTRLFRGERGPHTRPRRDKATRGRGHFVLCRAIICRLFLGYLSSGVSVSASKTYLRRNCILNLCEMES